jgi:Na+-driven multidrug efflux pump
LRERVYWIFFILLLLDFWNNIFGGVFRGLGKQAFFNVLNFISYYLICVPLAILFTFYIGSNSLPTTKGKGMGNPGIWLAFNIGMVFQVIA